MFTYVRLLPSVGPEMGLEVLQTRISFGATLELERDRRSDKKNRVNIVVLCREYQKERCLV